MDGGADEGGIKGAYEVDERVTTRRDIEMIGVLTERLASCERQNKAARRESEDALARLKEQQAANERAMTRIEQLEFENGYLRAESNVLRAAAQRTFYAGSSSLYLKLGAFERLESEVRELRAHRQHAEDLIRRVVPRSLRKRVRAFLFGSAGMP